MRAKLFDLPTIVSDGILFKDVYSAKNEKV